MKKNKNGEGFLEKVSGKLMLVKGSPITPKQILKIFERTPAQHIHTRTGNSGLEYDYVTGIYVKKVLNYVFGWLWDFEVVEHGVEGGFVWVKGRLTINDPDTRDQIIVKMQFGGAKIKYLKGTKQCLDFPNNLKAAATDALKKCASELGIASDIYGKNEFKEISFGNGIVPEKKGNDPVGVQPETGAIMKAANAMGASTPAQIFSLVKRVSGVELKDWRMTKSEAKAILSGLLAKKHTKKR